MELLSQERGKVVVVVVGVRLVGLIGFPWWDLGLRCTAERQQLHKLPEMRTGSLQPVLIYNLLCCSQEICILSNWDKSAE